jgi:hypothetical protein
MRDPHAGTTLETVSTGFVKGFTGTYIGEDLLFRYRVKSDIGTVISGQNLTVRGDNSDAGVNLMAPAGKEMQHPYSVISISRFAEDLFRPTRYQSISREDIAAGFRAAQAEALRRDRRLTASGAGREHSSSTSGASVRKGSPSL